MQISISIAHGDELVSDEDLMASAMSRIFVWQTSDEQKKKIALSFSMRSWRELASAFKARFAVRSSAACFFDFMSSSAYSFCRKLRISANFLLLIVGPCITTLESNSDCCGL